MDCEDVTARDAPVIIVPPIDNKIQWTNVMLQCRRMDQRLNPRMLKSEPMRRCRLHECRGACCLYGVWADRIEAENILQHSEEIAAELPEERANPALWFDGRREADEHSLSGEVLHSAVLEDPAHYGGTSCIFYRPDAKCALQTAAVSAGLHPWAWKPFYCILHPLDLDDEGRITLDETDLMLEEEGSCLRPSPEEIPLIEIFEEELRYFLGDKAYEELRQPPFQR